MAGEARHGCPTQEMAVSESTHHTAGQSAAAAQDWARMGPLWKKQIPLPPRLPSDSPTSTLKEVKWVWKNLNYMTAKRESGKHSFFFIFSLGKVGAQYVKCDNMESCFKRFWEDVNSRWLKKKFYYSVVSGENNWNSEILKSSSCEEQICPAIVNIFKIKIL